MERLEGLRTRLGAAGTSGVGAWLVVGVVGIATGVVPSKALANGIVRDSLGAVSSGRGGANVSHDDNLSILHDNPAGIAWLPEIFLGRAEVSNDFLFREVSYRDPWGSDRSTDGVFWLPQVSVAGRFEEIPFPLVFGLTAVLPGGYGVDYNLTHPIYGDSKYMSEGLLLKLLPTVAFKIGEYVSVGGGIGLGYGTSEFELPYTFQNQMSPLGGQTARVHLEAEGYGVTGNFGFQVRPIEGLTLGASVITETLTDQEGDFDVDVTGGPISALVTDTTATYDVDFRFRWPLSVTAGGSYELGWGRFSLEGVWYDWSHAFDEVHLHFSDGDNPEFDALAGTQFADTFPLDWRDSFSIRVGYEHFFTETFVARVGYIYNANPIPDRTLTPLLPGILEHSFSVGFGEQFGPIDVDIAYQYAFSDRRKVNQSDLLGDVNLGGASDFDNSTLRAQAHWIFVTLGMTF